MTEDQEREAIVARIMKLIWHKIINSRYGGSVFIYKDGDPTEEAMCEILSRVGSIVCLPDNGRGNVFKEYEIGTA